MKKLLNKKNRWMTFMLFVILSVLSLFLIRYTTINYDLRKYLPNDSKTIQALEVLEEEFENHATIQMMLSSDNVYVVSEVVEKIGNIEEVKSVIWLGSIADIYTPIESMDRDLIKDFYKDGKFLVTINLKDDEYSLVTEKGIDKIYDIMEEYTWEANFRGSAITNIFVRNITKKESLLIIGIVVPIAILILFLVATSWIEPVVVLISLGIAIIINLGTNFLMGEISFITMAIASVLQLAMSLDYSLFMVHRYYEKRLEGLDPINASITSTKEAFSSVSVSALTTMFGFLALVFMRYSIGKDIGFSLAKAILISFLVVVLLMPSLLIIFDKALLKTKTKTMKFKFNGYVEKSFKLRYVLTVSLVIVASVAYYLQTKTHYLYLDNPSNDPTVSINIDKEKISKVFGDYSPVVILYRNDQKGKAIELASELITHGGVEKIQSIFTDVDKTLGTNILPDEVIKNFEGPNYGRMIVYLNYDGESQEMYDLSDYLMEQSEYFLGDDHFILGVATSTSEIKKTVLEDGIVVQLVSVLAIALVIGIMFKSISIPILLVGIIKASIWINVSLSYLTNSPLIYIGFLVVSSLQLGATIDYAVLLSSRYQEFRLTLEVKEAMKTALAKSAPTIITSSLVLGVAGFTEAFVSSLGIVKEIGLLIGRGAILSGLLVLFILPALIMCCDGIIQATTYTKKLRKESKHEKI